MDRQSAMIPSAPAVDPRARATGAPGYLSCLSPKHEGRRSDERQSGTIAEIAQPSPKQAGKVITQARRML